ncbi:MAG: hypothetical protein WA080_06645 [Sulfuricurvum sp.]
MFKTLFLLVILFIFSQSAFSVEIDKEFTRTKKMSKSLAVEGCTIPIIEGIAQKWMSFSAKQGKKFADVDEAEENMTSLVIWKKEVNPVLHDICQCSMSEFLDAIKKAKTMEEMLSVLSRFQTPQYKEIVMKKGASCFIESELANSLDKLFSKK